MEKIKIAGLSNSCIEKMEKGIKKQLKVESRQVTWIRPDGLKVFFDDERFPWAARLNAIRVYGTRKEVILAVGIVKGLIIMKNYAFMHGNEEEQNFFEEKLKLMLEDNEDKNEHLALNTLHFLNKKGKEEHPNEIDTNLLDKLLEEENEEKENKG